ncbi:AMP-binding protein [Flexivirga oryzae]|uniref:2-furoate---CoA ligase n=1 Tax=Flexivirga oryzae TaxID=1794944 RepID=A0A839MZZ8_9MICO|nr:AMP-binding protein [Flexivirga oryzae]MBB2891040.1 2-furoate---CoA ligase [Flexivirga oryzae]
MEIGRMLTWSAERFPERLAVAGSRRMTYREWDERTNRIASMMLRLGVRPGDRVAMFLSNSEVMASTHLALQKIGVMSTPLNIRLAASELAYCVRDADPRVVIVDDLAREVAEQALAQAPVDPVLLYAGLDPLGGARSFEDLVADANHDAPDVVVRDADPSVMLYTSGTTGRPKGVPRTQHAEVSASVAHVMQCQYAYGESTLGAMPMYHTMGLRALQSMIVVGGTFVEMPVFEAPAAIELILKEKISALYLVPTAYWALAETGRLDEVGQSVRKLAFAGAAMTSTLCETLEASIAPEVFVNHYGSSEVYTFAVEERASRKPGSAGRPGLFTRLRVVDPAVGGSHEPLAPDVVGEIVASLDADEAFQGYWNRPDADAKSIRGRWYHTGDLGHFDADGDLWVDGRVDDMIISGGENVHPVEVEDVLSRHPDVSEVAVVGLRDEKWGQAVTAFVVPTNLAIDPETLVARLEQWCRNDAPLSPYKRPKRFRVIASIPKSPVGKILRRKLVVDDEV